MLRLVKDVSVTNKSVILRCDLNVPMKDSVIIDKSRIIASLETIKYLMSSGAKIIIISHFGRPEGKMNEKYSLLPVCKALSEILNHNIHFISDITSQDSIQKVHKLPYGDIVMLENLRFHKEEEDGCDEFAQKIAEYGNIFVNEAFSCSHRDHASITKITKFLPSFAGINLAKEIFQIDKILNNQNEKIMSLVGGGKVSSKINLLTNLVQKSQILALGGGMANTFLAAKGIDIGLSFDEKDQISKAIEIMDLAQKNNCEIILPQDVMISESFDAPENSKICNIQEISKRGMILDIGHKTLCSIENAMSEVQNVIWNGPFGVYENPPFNIGSISLARIIAEKTSRGLIKSIVGGGDAVACATLSGLAQEFTFISTAGGAFLEYLEGNSLPGIDVLKGGIDL